MKPKSPLVSIVMPVKSTSNYLAECLDSIVSQRFKSWELIAIDDHSTDTSLEILNQYSAKDERIQVIQNNGNGIIDALQLAFKSSSGHFITRMDADDIMEPDKVELMLLQLQKKGRGYLCVGLVNYFSDGTLGEGYINYANWLNTLSTSETNFEDIYKECPIPSPCWMTHREDLIKSDAFNPTIYPEDYDLAFRFRKQGLKITSVNKVVHHWRDYKTRTSRTDDHYADNNFSELKTMHFIDQDYNTKTPLVLWGAGRKAKKIASSLQLQKTPFKWLCNNINKIGKDIYGVILEDFNQLEDLNKHQVIVAIKEVDTEDTIESFILNHKQHQYFRFS